MKIANLKAEEEALQQVQEAKNEELECKLRLERAKMESERKRLQQKIIQAQLEDNILNNSEPIQTNVIKKEKPTKNEKPKEPRKKIDKDNNDTMMEVMMKLVDLNTAPDVDIDVFQGDPLEYSYFRAAFRDVVERKVADSSGRLMRPLKYTSGDAKDLISIVFMKMKVQASIKPSSCSTMSMVTINYW